MSTKSILNVPKVWYKFTQPASNGRKFKLRWEQLSEQRYEEFLDFNMEYYVKEEILHIAAGIPKSSEAMTEYRKLASGFFKDPIFNISICCLDDKKNDIVGFSTLKLCKKGEIYNDNLQAHSPELNEYLRIVNECHDLFPIQKVIEKYGVERFMEDMGCAIHPDFRRNGMCTEVSKLRCMISKANSVPMTGAWITALPTQQALKHKGWITIFEINREEVEKKLRIKLHNALPSLMYSIKHVN